MSCDGWSVGDRCQALVAFHVTERTLTNLGTTSRTTTIQRGDEGVVREKFSPVHQLAVYWNRLQQTLRLGHDQIHNLRKLR